MSSMTFGQKTFTPIAPEKGSFPLDHEGACKKLMVKYMLCLDVNRSDNSACRQESREYLACRMDNNLMAKEDWSKLGCTGSVATIKLPQLLTSLLSMSSDSNLKISINVRVIVTDHAKHFCDPTSDVPANVAVFSDTDEWSAWTKRGDPVLHVELAKWADVFVIAPLDANTLAKISNGLCDNLLTCTARAWDLTKPLVFCPAMNTKMYRHPLTAAQISVLTGWGYQHVPVIEKTLICGDVGEGAMAEVATIVEYIKNIVIVQQ